MLATATKYSSKITSSSSRQSRTLSLFAYNNNKAAVNRILPRNAVPQVAFSTILNNQHQNHHHNHPYNNLNLHTKHHNNHKALQSRLFSISPDQVLYYTEDDEDETQTQAQSTAKNDMPTTSIPNPTTTPEPELIIESKPVPGGNWNPDDPLAWCANFGRRDPEKEKELFKKAQLKPGDEGYFDVSQITVPGVTMVRTKEEAEIVMKRLMSPESEKTIHACDTEVMEIALKDVGPVGNGFVTCASIYSGPNFDYGLGDGPGTALWIDNLDDSFGVLQVFKEFFEDERFETVWHNYGFDRHVMWNEGIDVRGLKGDTMHMARLEDTSRMKYGAGMGYSLEALTSDILGRRKKPMKEIFGVARLRKDGSAGSMIDVPPVEVLQRDPRFRKQWIVYSAYDAEGTWLLRDQLQKRLETMDWVSFFLIFMLFSHFSIFPVYIHYFIIECNIILILCSSYLHISIKG
jgi:hypothetical protein